MTAQQLALNLPHLQALGREDFYVTPSNAAAVALVDQWPAWPSHGAIILGEEGSGKSHLASVWQQRSGGVLLPLQALTIESVPGHFAKGPVALEAGAAFDGDERALFHALNFARQDGSSLLITTPVLPSAWDIKLPDLRSRLQALPIAAMGQPDDALLRAVLVKQFTDRQLEISETIVSFLVARMPRSLGFVRTLVDEVDSAALEAGAEITRPFVARVLDRLSRPGMPGIG
jgi:chromosomal replication initiation ATPase DnaA